MAVPMRFDGQVAIITGGASGIGQATAEQLALEGASVMIADLSPQGAEVVAAMTERGMKAAFTRVDVYSEEQVVAMVAGTVDLWGRLDVMVANAGISTKGSADQTELAEWERVVNVNLTGVFLCGKHAIPAMRASGGGAIINTASMFGLVGFGNRVAYTAAKGGVVNLTRAMALDHAKENIRVNAVCPGFIHTPLAAAGILKDKEMHDYVASLQPIGRLGKPEEVAKAIAFLSSDDASFITGAMLAVDGGYTAQ